MSLLNKGSGGFFFNAYHKDNFCTVEKKDILGKSGPYSFLSCSFSFVCPTELEDLQNSMRASEIGCEIYAVYRYPF